ncbi:MAG: phytanoyl-CoA dioxygenase family protein [Candidatus Binataceae bacterium]|jgi:ectoine hydroxylase-related dioxygenase (phytanoyl-CoA dioxygenase family)
MSDALPQITRDLAQAKLDLDSFGYCLIAEALAPGDLRALRERLVEQAAAEAEIGRATRDGGPGAPNQRVWNLINKGRAFRDLIIHPLVDAMMPHLLGTGFILSSLTANIAGPGGAPMYLHRDQGYLPFHTPTPVVANIAWMLDDVTSANGGTRLVPRSHLSAAPLGDPADTSQTIAAQGPAGSALVFDGRIFHGTGPNSTESRRHVLLSYFARPFMRAQENPFLSLDAEVERALSDRLKARLGYKIWGTLGGVEGPAEAAIVARPAHPLGEMTPQSKNGGARA